MRIWHEDLIPKLCQKHLCAMWREGLGCYKIVTGEVDGGSYKNHPATKEFINNPNWLWVRLYQIRREMLNRGYHPKEMPLMIPFHKSTGEIKEWQTLDQQIEVLKLKHCKCNL